ncbi:MAG: hypothetical protein ACLPJH_06800 [Myxococcaceae bacterium]
MATHLLCSECRTANRVGLLFCVVCGRRLPRGAFPPDRVTALAWPGPEVREVSPPARPSALAWASLIAAVLGWSVLPLLGAALAVLLALRALEEGRTGGPPPGGGAVLRLALWLGGVQLVLALVAGAAMAAVALTSLWRAG